MSELEAPAYAEQMLAYRDQVVAFDIETVPVEAPDQLPKQLRERLERHARRSALRDGAEPTTEAVLELVRLEQSTNPLLGRIVSLGLQGTEEGSACVLVAAERAQLASDTDPMPAYVKFVTESELCCAFWQVLETAKRLVSFNGRRFDLPFLDVRSRILKVESKLSRLGSRHDDVSEMLPAGSRGHLGSLDLYCHAFGVKDPKGHHAGSDVARLVEAGQLAALAEYNLGDVKATLELWLRF